MAIFSSATMGNVTHKMTDASAKFTTELSSITDQVILNIPSLVEDMRQRLATFDTYYQQFSANKAAYIQDSNYDTAKLYYAVFYAFPGVFQSKYNAWIENHTIFVTYSTEFIKSFNHDKTLELRAAAQVCKVHDNNFNALYNQTQPSALLAGIQANFNTMSDWEDVGTADRVATIESLNEKCVKLANFMQSLYDIQNKFAYDFKLFLKTMTSTMDTAIAEVQVYDPDQKSQFIMTFLADYYALLKEWMFMTSSKIYNEEDNMYVDLPLILSLCRANEPQKLNLIFRQTILWELITSRAFDVRDAAYSYTALPVWKCYRFLQSFFIYDHDPSVITYKGSMLAEDEYGNPFFGVVEDPSGVRVLMDGGFPKYYNSKYNGATTYADLSNDNKIIANFLNWVKKPDVLTHKVAVISSAISTGNYAASSSAGSGFKTTFTEIAKTVGFTAECFSRDEYDQLSIIKLRQFDAIIWISSDMTISLDTIDLVYEQVDSSKTGLMIITDDDRFNASANNLSKRFGVEFYGNVNRSPVDIQDQIEKFGDHPIWANIVGEIYGGGSEGSIKLIENNGVSLPEVIPQQLDPNNLYQEFDIRWTDDPLYQKFLIENQHSELAIKDHVSRLDVLAKLHDDITVILNQQNAEAFAALDETSTEVENVLEPDLLEVAVVVSTLTSSNQSSLDKVIKAMASKLAGRGLKLYYPWNKPIILVLSIVGYLKFNVACVYYSQDITDLIELR